MKSKLSLIILLLAILYSNHFYGKIYIDQSLSRFPVIKTDNENEVLHIFSHGRPGQLFINHQWMGKEQILTFIKNKLQSEKELLLYGCEFAKGEKGKEAIHYLERELGISISASEDITGAAGNWILEYGKSPHTIHVLYYSENLQLDNLHYLNPVLFTNYANDMTEEYIYLSTPSTSNITISVNFASGIGSPRMSVYNISNATSSIITNGLITFNNSSPRRIIFVNNSNTILAPGLSPITLPSTSAGIIVSGNTAGLIFSSTDNFYVNYMGRQINHAGSVLTKGKSALGKEFRWGGAPTQYTTSNTDVGNILSIMATENDTNIEVSNIKPGVEFLNGSNPTKLTGTSFSRTLQKGESFILYAPVKNNSLSIQDTGWLGAKVASNKDICVVAGGLMMLGGNGSSRDIGLDQLVPVNQIGTDYIVMQGNGGSNERIIVVATENNTTVFVNGSSTPITTLTNAGDYTILNAAGNFNSNGNLYVKTGKPSYVYHKIYGSSSAATNNIVLVTPLSCFGENEINLIPDAHKIGNTPYSNTQLSVLAISGNPPTVTINGTAVSPFQSGAAVTGNSTWVSYKYLIGDASTAVKNVRVFSARPIQADLLGADSNAGFGGYYSGFGTTPIVNITFNTSYPKACQGVSILSVPSGLGTYQWYKDGVAIPGATSSSLPLSSVAATSSEYNVIVTIPGGCTIGSNFILSDTCPCSKPGTVGTPDSGTKFGISIRDNRSTNNWPNDINNGFISLESNTQGFVITRIANPDISITNPVEGMIVYDTDNSCIKLYNGTSWNCIEQTCN